MSDLKEKLLNAKSGKVAHIYLADHDAHAYIRVLTHGERDRWESNIKIVDGRAQVAGKRSAFLAMCLCDEDGKRLFKDTEAHLIDAMDAPIVDQLWATADEVNTFTEEDVEVLEGN